MSVIQKIRDKYAVAIIVIICLSIVGFLLQEAFFGRGSLMGKSTAAGKVNGQEIDYTEYNDLIQKNETQYRRQMGGIALNEQQRQQLREDAWNQLLSERILSAQYKALGIEVTNDELGDLLTGKNVSPIWMQYFTDPQTGQFNRAQADAALANIKNDKTGQGTAELMQIEDDIIKSQLRQKYFSLVKQAVYLPNWLATQQLKDNSTNANITYVNVPYTSIADSTVKVSDGELQAYIDNHKALFKTEEARKVEYMVFDATPSPADTAAALKALVELKEEMDTTKDVAGLINRNSDQKFFDAFAPESKIMVPQKDSIIHLGIGQIFGPYYDNNEIVYAKLVDRKQMPDSVKFGHILISLQTQSDSIAKKRADSIMEAIHGGADFKTLAMQLSDDPGSKQNGGEYDITPMQTFPEQLKELNDYVLSNPAGSLKVIKTPVGYSIVKIIEVKNIGPAIKVAYLSKTVEASQETNSAAFSEASSFAANNRTQAAFNKSAQEKGTKRVADNIRPMDFVINGLGSSRELVKWAYDAKVGDVSSVFTLEDKYAVAVLTEAREAGTAKLAAVKPLVEAEVKRIKKAAQITAKLGNASSVEAAATATNQPVMQAEGVNFATPFVASLGFEPKVVGAAFNKAWGTAKASIPIPGNAGVYVIKVNAYVPAQNGQDINNVKASYEQGIQGTLSNSLFEVLKDKADVKDTRSKFM
ncbi:peptidyl-prolyl cis-trans isomerase D [Chitinophaga costaii]|uniref:Periplasmic chaperone PpiD n=1 Tax=Chitinophaga costaii TaxID=1335309 RepID=A0A1C4AHU6_9BACT|nr:peptidylprolyl isomerase [Chitinophaga costaii]PUZ26611.1 hypothetical protein DCM91_09380 [Chitinophaga costaii]SCB94224.1 peptidyl-prolyl cis-trans isomerase D [Chitinophaga costaii]